jgi:GTP-binding protein
MVDGVDGPSDQDTKMMQYILDQHKAVILVVNKTDLGEQEIPAFRSTLRARIAREFHFYEDVPIAFISAKTGAGVDKMFHLIDEIWRKLHIEIPTSQLNDFFFETIRKAPAPVHGTKNVKFYYLTQTKQTPPSFIAFANHPEGVSPSYRRFLSKHIQQRWDLHGIPVRIFAMKSRSH